MCGICRCWDLVLCNFFYRRAKSYEKFFNTKSLNFFFCQVQGCLVPLKRSPGCDNRRRRNSLPTGRNLEQDLDEEDPPADSWSCSGVWKCLYDSGLRYQEEDSFSVFGNQPKLSATWADSLCLPLFQIYQPIPDPPHLPSSFPTSLSSLGGGFLPVSTSPLAERERFIRAPLNLHSLPLLCFSLLRFPFSRLL